MHRGLKISVSDAHALEEKDDNGDSSDNVGDDLKVTFQSRLVVKLDI